MRSPFRARFPTWASRARRRSRRRGTLFYLIVAAGIMASLAAGGLYAGKRLPSADPGRRRAAPGAGGRPDGASPRRARLRHVYRAPGFPRARSRSSRLARAARRSGRAAHLQFSDIHLSAFLSEAELARVVDAARELRPHLAVVTGDLISSRGDPLDACIRQLARLKADAGVFGCMGNHERYARGENYTASRRRGWVSTSCARRRGSFVLAARCSTWPAWIISRLAERDLLSERRRTLVAPGAANVLLSHNPDVFPVAARQGYNLVLAGHTHGGQVTVEILDQSINPARFFTPYVYGLYRAGRGGGVCDARHRHHRHSGAHRRASRNLRCCG